MSGSTNPSFMNGIPELLLLRLIHRREMYGYELVQAVREASGEAIALGEGSIYPVLHALERAGCLSSKRRQVDGRSRLYYRLTGDGKKKLGLVENEWKRIARAVTLVLGGRNAAKPT